MKGVGWKKILKRGVSIQKGVPLLKGPNSRLKILALWAFLGIQEMQNSKFSPTMVELCPNYNIPFPLC